LAIVKAAGAVFYRREHDAEQPPARDSSCNQDEADLIETPGAAVGAHGNSHDDGAQIPRGVERQSA
jgi:hypothetical protein